MADERIIRIKIDDGNGGSEGTNHKEQKEESRAKQIIKILNNPIEGVIDSITQGKNYLLANVIEKTANETIENVEFCITRKWELTENYIAETNYANARQITKKTASIVSGVIMMGATFGYGGAVVSLALSAVNGISTAMKKNDAIYRQLSEQTINTQYSAKRMGLIDNNRGTEN